MACQIKELAEYILTNSDKKSDVWKQVNAVINADKNIVINSSQVEFNKLPNYKEGQKTMTYAGIGSRETPKEVLELMTKAATWLEYKGYKLQTGYKRKQTNGKLVEEGADKAFSDGTNNKELFGPDMANATTRNIAEEIHPNLKGMWSAVYNKWVSKVGKEKATEYADGAIGLQERNTFQVFGAELDTAVDFVLFYAIETDNPLRPKGGTGQAVEMARRKGIPTINMADKDWRKELTKAISKKPTEAEAKPKNDIVNPINEARNALKEIDSGSDSGFNKRLRAISKLIEGC